MPLYNQKADYVGDGGALSAQGWTDIEMNMKGEDLPGAAAYLAAAPLAPFLLGRSVDQVGEEPADVAPGFHDVLVAPHRLQVLDDYRAALQAWFGGVKPGGLLVIIVPGAFLFERQITMPSPWRHTHRRLYTPASLALEIEEALYPNSYRMRWLGDLDEGYDYALPPSAAPTGRSDVAAVIQRIAPPAWSVHRAPKPIEPIIADNPPFAFAPVHTRIEIARFPTAPVARILLMKLDHMGDLIMGLPALERMRAYFPEAAIDLVVGSWNAQIARELGIADRVIPFDAFPRNSTEEDANVEATLGLFRTLVKDAYDLAVDMRTDTDTRTLLRAVNATTKAGIGSRSNLPFLDIALPLDATRNEAERAEQHDIGPGLFHVQREARRSHFSIHSDRTKVGRDTAIIWGPYRELEPGNYIFDFFMDVESENRGDGLLLLDVALDGGRTVSEMVVSQPTTYQLPFRVDKPGTKFEARIRTIEGNPSLSFSFFGGRLIRQGRGNVLHQTEYGLLLVELVKLRMIDLDGLEDVAAP